MKVAQYMDDKMLIEKGVDALLEKLGPIDAIRFFNLSKSARIDSVKWHRDWQSKLDRNQFYDEVFRI